MKKQFERLWYLALDQLAEEHTGRFAPDNITELERQKFAELIVRECANIANAGIDPCESHLIGNDILKHFGVEE